ncbi:estrogen receptor gamma-like isoform X1 [Pecten maximus]|uniref:estrogen receptor gamma-like isoform X1 n=1 Tax=Pecten maximus TaxID=6579 RepID=UPI001458C42C|nr:estrogen receptor gamma-like isoform X1 [Pecten maximus]XP_033733858.1 estrogen receptor gamma-like isoform X1 [Pecten maximus]
MPPPKKPKTGRTSIDQFLSNEEQMVRDGYIRDRCWSYSSRESIDSIRNRSGSTSGESDIRDRTNSYSGESDISRGSPRQSLDLECTTFSAESRSNGLKLLRELIIKKKDTEEQRVPGGSCGEQSPVSGSASPTNSNTSEKITDVDMKSPPCKVEKVEKFDSTDNIDRKPSPDPLPPAAEKREVLVVPNIEGKVKTASKTCVTSAFNKKSDDKLLNNLVASSLMTSRANGMPMTTVPSYLSPYYYGHSPILSSMYTNGMESEPRDLSRKVPKSENSLETRYFESLSLGLSDSNLHSYMHFNLNPYNSVPAANEKQYLEARKNLVGMLKEPRFSNSGHVGYPTPPAEKDVTFGGAFPFFVNGYDLHRDSLDKMAPKEEHPGVGGMMSPGNYLSVSHLMPPSSHVPSSTTSDMRDHEGSLLPLLDASMSYAGSRKFKQHSNSAGPNTNKLCQVCNDNASGFHYGVWSCEGCKAFFKRSIQGPVDYVCPATNTCTIDKHRRKSCQACRLRKCYEVGMNKGSQRKDRKSCLSMGKHTTKRNRADSMDNTVNSTSGSPNPAKSSRRSQTSTILDILAKADLPTIESFHNHNVPPTKVHLLNSLTKLSERELVHLINWAKNVPGYTELSLSDQVHLIECCWMELILLNCAYRSMDHGGKRLAFASDLILERPHWGTVGMSEIFEQVAAVSEQMVQCNLHKDELLLLQATVLVNAEVRKLASCSKIYEMRQTILDALVDTAQKYHPDNLRHVPSILLLLTHLRQAGERGIAYFQKLKNEETVYFCDLLKEMLDAQDYSEKRAGNEGE